MSIHQLLFNETLERHPPSIRTTDSSKICNNRDYIFDKSHLPIVGLEGDVGQNQHPCGYITVSIGYNYCAIVMQYLFSGDCRSAPDFTYSLFFTCMLKVSEVFVIYQYKTHISIMKTFHELVVQALEHCRSLSFLDL